MKKLALNTLVSLGIAAFFLWLAVRGMLRDASGSIEGGDVWSALASSFRAVPTTDLALFGGLYLIVHLSRAMRWVYQVAPLGAKDTAQVLRICLTGFGAIVIFPLRLGEVIRPWLLARETRIPFAAAMGTAVVERIFDGLLITLLLFVAVVTAPEPASPLVWNAAWASLAVFASASVGLTLFVVRRAWAEWLLDQTFGRASPRIAQALRDLLAGFVEGVRSLRGAGALPGFLLMTVVYWGTNALSMALLARAFGMDLPLWAGFGLVPVLVVGIMIPAGPGFFGNFQLFLMEGVRLYAPASSVGAAALAFALTVNCLQLLIQLVTAVPGLLAMGLSPGKLVAMQQAASDRAANEAPDPTG